jgi:hypothetical protein
MVSSIQSSSPVLNAYHDSSATRPPAQNGASQSHALPQDTVEISAKGQAMAQQQSMGDVEHDGDSH